MNNGVNRLMFRNNSTLFRKKYRFFRFRSDIFLLFRSILGEDEFEEDEEEY